MSTVLYGLGRAAFRRRGTVLVAWLLVLLAIGGAAGGLAKSFNDDFELPGTESQAGLDTLNHTFPQVSGVTAQVIVVAPEGSEVTDPDVRAAVDDLVDSLGELDQVEAVASPYDENISGAISDSGRAGLVTVQLQGQATDITTGTKDAITDLTAQVVQDAPGTEASAGGGAFQEVTVGLSWVDGLGVLVALVVLWVTLGSLRAAGLPLLTAIWGVGISVLAIVAGTALMAINSTTIMLALMLGLAVGIDYALFIISRHRDQLASGLDPEESAARAVATSGSAVVFAGLTVMIALCGLAVAGIPFLTTMGVAAAAAVGIAVLIAITGLPALMGVLGERLRPKPRRHPSAQQLAAQQAAVQQPAQQAGPQHAAQQQTGPAKARRGWAERWVGLATKVPALTVVVIVIGLGALAIPASGLKLALPDAGDNPAGSPTRVTYDLVSEHFGPGHNGPLIMTVDIVASDDPLGVMDGIKERIEQVPGVAEVPLATPNPSIDTGIVQIVPTTAPDDPATTELVHRLRALQPEFQSEYDVATMVTGVTAVQIDVSEQLGQALAPFAVVVVGLSLVLLTIVFRSLWVPIKAAIGYLFSVVAAFGVVAAVFEYGVGASLLGLDQTGPVISFLPIMLMGILFGLAMDYEVFLVSRIREEHVHGTPAREAIRTGFVASSRVVLAAGLIMFAVFAAFVPEGDAILKSIALGLAVGIFVDAFVVRMTLVPAVLHLLGEKAWYLPQWLDRLLPSFDVEGEGLQHRLALTDWPTPGARPAVAAEGIRVGGATLLEAGRLVLGPGQLATLEAEDVSRRTAVLLALTGRVGIEDGRLKVGDLVLPQQAADARRRTHYLDLEQPGSVAELEALATRAARGHRRHPMVAVALDHVDRIATDDRDRLSTAVGQLRDHGVAVVADRTLPGPRPVPAPPDPNGQGRPTAVTPTYV